MMETKTTTTTTMNERKKKTSGENLKFGREKPYKDCFQRQSFHHWNCNKVLRNLIINFYLILRTYLEVSKNFIMDDKNNS